MSDPSADDAIRRVRALKELAQAARRAGAPDEAARLYRDAVAACAGTRDDALLAHTVRHLADVEAERGALDEARGLYGQALELYAAHVGTAPLDLANARRSAALLEARLANRARARDLWQQARAGYLEAGVAAGVEECDRNLRELEGLPPRG